MNTVLQNWNKTEIWKIRFFLKVSLAFSPASLDFSIWGRYLWLFEQILHTSSGSGYPGKSLEV